MRRLTDAYLHTLGGDAVEVGGKHPTSVLAVGTLAGWDAKALTIETKRGPVEVARADIGHLEAMDDATAKRWASLGHL